MLSIRHLTDTSLLVQRHGLVSAEHQHALAQLAQACAKLPACVEQVVGMNSLLLVFEPQSRLDFTNYQSLIQQLWLRPPHQPSNSRTLVIPVYYGGTWGPDLTEVAKLTGLTPDSVIQQHSQTEYYVYCLGFQPGFAYLGGLVNSLAVPRRAQPRCQVPAGSVAIGANQTGIYPSASPGGWHIIGWTPLKLFNVNAEPPGLIQLGDRIRFQQQAP